MTNAEIIYRNSVGLALEGVLEVDPETGLPESIHTYAAWKSMGYSVKRGEHAIAAFPIWKYSTTSKIETDENGAVKDTRRAFLKTSHFFKRSQVERITV